MSHQTAEMLPQFWLSQLKRLVQLGREIHGLALLDKPVSDSCRFRNWLRCTVCGHRVDYLATTLFYQSRATEESGTVAAPFVEPERKSVTFGCAIECPQHHPEIRFIRMNTIVAFESFKKYNRNAKSEWIELRGRTKIPIHSSKQGAPMRKCPKCDAEVADDRWICRKCGSIVQEVELASESEPPVTPEIIPQANVRHATGDKPRLFVQPKPFAPEPSTRDTSGDDIWTCPKCASPVTHEFAVCWNCGTTPDGVEDPNFPACDTWEDDDKPRDVPGIDLGRAASGPTPARGQVCARHFRSSFDSWEQLSQQAANFATELGPQRLISISHSEDGNDGVIIVWYWD